MRLNRVWMKEEEELLYEGMRMLPAYKPGVEFVWKMGTHCRHSLTSIDVEAWGRCL